MQPHRLRAGLRLAAVLAITCGLHFAVLLIAARAADNADREQWYTVSSGDVVFGSVHSVRQIQPNGTLRYSEDSRMLVNLLGQRQEISESFECVVTASLEPVSFRQQSIRASGTTTAVGRVEDGEFVITLKRGDAALTRRIPLSERPILSVCLADALADSKLGVGDSVKLALVDDASWSLKRITAKRLDDTDGHRRFMVADDNTTNGRTWSLSADGLLEAVTSVAPDRVIRRATAQAADELTHLKFSNRELLLFPLNREIAFPERAERIVVKLVWQGLPFEQLQLVDARQKIVRQSHEQDQYSVELALEQPAAIEDAARLPVTDESLAEYLAETQFIRPHDPAIRDQARQWTDESTTTLEAARRLSHEVSNYLEGGELIAETLSGPEVLACRKGKCSEFTTLLASLARSIGIPTRVALGMRLSGGQWVGHMWCEMWVGRWIAVDATADEVGGSPALLKLTHSRTVMGTQSVRWELTKSLELEVVDVKLGEKTDLGLSTGIVGQAYTNADFACRITAPNEWTLVDKSQPGQVIIQLKPPGTFEGGEPLVHFVAFSLPTKLAPSVLINGRKVRFASTYKDFKVLTDKQEMVGPFDAQRLCFRYTSGKSQAIKTTEIMWTGKRSGFLLNLIAEASTHDAMKEPFEAVLRSFETMRAAPVDGDQQPE